MTQNRINSENFAIGEVNNRRVAVNRINSNEMYIWKECRVKDSYWFKMAQNETHGNNKYAYSRVRVGNKSYLTNRVVYKLFNKSFDVESRTGLVVAHRDEDTLNNHIDNLFIITHNQALWKQKGARGTKQYGVSGLWAAYIGVNGKKYHVYGFETQEEAHKSYLDMKKKYHIISAK